MSTNIIGPSQRSPDDTQSWARARGAHQRLIDVIPLYYQTAPRYGIEPEGAVAQACHETNYGKYTGVVPPGFHNWCGLKRLAGTADDDPQAHQRFASDEEGVLAHIQHLARYAGASGPAPGDQIVDPRWSLVQAGIATTYEGLGGRWAPAADYGNVVVRVRANLVAFGRASSKVRIIVGAGHEHIDQIKADRIGRESAQRLRTSTGALGREAEWTAPWADALVDRLSRLGVNAVRTDAIYHPDVYRADADLVVFGHCDGVNSMHAQWCMAAAVVSGGSTDDADARANDFVTHWMRRYPELTGIRSNGPITDDMTHYYGGSYRTVDTPAVLLEHFILGMGGVWSHDLTPTQAADADAEVLKSFFNLEQGFQFPNDDSPDPRVWHCTVTDKWVVDPRFLDYYSRQGNDAVSLFGLPIAGQVGSSQYFERARFELHPELAGTPREVQLGLLGSELTAHRHDEAPFQPASPSDASLCTTFTETHHNLCGAFRDFWQGHGGLELFGFPISEELTDERGVTVQYFERARFEWHPENPDPFKVLLTRLGAEALERR